MDDKLKLLERIINSSKEFKFNSNDILNIRKYYDISQSININFIGLIEVCYEKLEPEDIDRFILTDEELREDQEEDYY